MSDEEITSLCCGHLGCGCRQVITKYRGYFVCTCWDGDSSGRCPQCFAPMGWKDNDLIGDHKPNCSLFPQLCFWEQICPKHKEPIQQCFNKKERKTSFS